MNMGFSQRWDAIVSQFAEYEAISNSGRRVTYRTLAAQANAYACKLADLGIRNSCIAVLLPDPLEHIAALLGILLAGNYYHSLSLERADTVGQVLDSIGAIALIAPTDIIEPHQLADSVALIHSSIGSPQPHHRVNLPIEPSAAFCLFTTSGTTGEPKQVVHSHQYILADTDRQILANQIEPGDRIDLLFSLEFSASLACIFPALLSGAGLVVHDLKKEGVLSLADFWQRERITFSTLSVSTFRLLLKSSFDFKSLDKLRFLSIGAEPVRRRDIDGFQERFAATTTLQVAYATTETRTITEHKICTTTPWSETLNSVGKVVEGRNVRIQAETGGWLGAGQVGEILVQAAAMPQGYANPGARQWAYQVQPDGSVFYATGDLGYLDEAGYLFWCGRTDFMVKRNGQKINLLLVEDELRQAPGVEAVALVCDLDASVQPLILAFVSPGNSFDLSIVKRWLANRLPTLMLPDTYHVIQDLPRTRTGKIDRPQLVRLAKATQIERSVRLHEPANGLVDQIKRIWAQELNYPGLITDYDDFFQDLGGDSLLAEACLATLEAETNQSLPMQLAFSYSTPQSLASFISTPTETGVQCISLNPPVTGRVQIYFIPPLSGDKRIYQGLEEALRDHANLYCLYFSPFTPDGQLRKLAELSDSMAQYLDTSSPNLVIGYSFGGILAYEVALRLDRQSPPHSLNRLVLVDTPLYKRHSFHWVLAQDLKRSWRKLQRGLHASEPLNVRANLQRVLSRYYGRLKPSSPLLVPTDWQQKADFAAQSMSQQVNIREPVQRPILLIRATDSSFFDRDIQPDYNWQAYTNSWVDEHLINTNHYHVLNPAHSAQVARLVLRIIDSKEQSPLFTSRDEK